jgi:uncharacterized phage protein (TIGR01671 family)
MRHIKFRTFSKSRGMIDLNATTGRATIVMWPIMRACEYDKNEKQVDMPLMQYTGLKDKNGVEIYEDDVFRVNYNYIGINTVVFEKGGYNVASYNLKKCEVIGNIHQHPELIKGE